MHTTIQKWGNSLALRIPRHLATDLGLKLETQVELRVHDGVLEIVPSAPSPPTLADLLGQITPENQHAEVDAASPVGREYW